MVHAHTILFMLVIGCTGPATKQVTTEADKTTLEHSASNGEPTLDTQDKTPPSECIKTCLASNQARAVAWHIIERDCAVACGEEDLPTQPE